LNNCFDCEFRSVFGIDVKDLSLSVERINHVSLDTVKRLVWELFQIAIQHMARNLSYDLSFVDVYDHMVVCSCVIMKNIDENLIIIDPAAISKRIRKHFVAHRRVIIANHLIDIYFVFFYLLLCSCFLSKCSEGPISVIVEECCILFSGGVLFHFFKFDIWVLTTAYLFFECQMVIFEIIHFNVVVTIIFLCNGKSFCWVVGDQHWHDWKSSNNWFLLQ